MAQSDRELNPALPARAEDPDRQWVVAAQRGDTEALGALYDRHAPLLLGMARNMLPSPSGAEDLVHDVFMEAWRTIRRFDPERGSVRSWLATILRSRAIDRRRSEDRRRDRVAPTGEVDRVDGRARPDHHAERQGVRAMVGRLPPIYREALTMTYFEGATLAECAAALEVPVGTIKARVSRAVALLRTQLMAEEER